jgi:hypothetical protein
MTHISNELAAIRLSRIVELGKKMRRLENDYYFHHVQTAKDRMRKAQREFDTLLKLETEVLKSKQLNIV